MPIYTEEEPQYFNLTEYKTIDELNKDINNRICNGLYLNNIESEIIDETNIPINKLFIHISYDSDYYCVLVEKCKFSGYLYESLSTKNNNFTLLFHSEDLQTDIKLSLEDVKKQIFCQKDEDKILQSLKSYYSYYKNLKYEIFNKINKVTNVICELNKIKIEDNKNIINKDLKTYSDVFPTNDLLNSMINNLIIMVENYYKRNRIFTLEGEPNDANFIRHMRDMLIENNKNAKAITDATDETDETDEERTIVKKNKNDDEKLEDDKQIF